MKKSNAFSLLINHYIIFKTWLNFSQKYLKSIRKISQNNYLDNRSKKLEINYLN